MGGGREKGRWLRNAEKTKAGKKLIVERTNRFSFSRGNVSKVGCNDCLCLLVFSFVRYCEVRILLTRNFSIGVSTWNNVLLTNWKSFVLYLCIYLCVKKLYKDEAVQIISQTIDVSSRVNDVLKLEESLSRLIGDGLIIKSSCVDRMHKRYESMFKK